MNCKIPTKQKAIKAPSLTSFLLWGFYGIIHCAFLFAIIAGNNQTRDEVITLIFFSGNCMHKRKNIE